MIYTTLTSDECDHVICKAAMQISIVKNDVLMFTREKEILIGVYEHQIKLSKERKADLLRASARIVRVTNE